MGESELGVKPNGSFVGYRDAGIDSMDIRILKDLEQALIQEISKPFSGMCWIQIDAGLDRSVICGFVPETAAAGISYDDTIDLGHDQAVSALRVVGSYPSSPILDAEGLKVERDGRVDDVVVVDPGDG